MDSSFKKLRKFLKLRLVLFLFFQSIVLRSLITSLYSKVFVRDIVCGSERGTENGQPISEVCLKGRNPRHRNFGKVEGMTCCTSRPSLPVIHGISVDATTNPVSL